MSGFIAIIHVDGRPVDRRELKSFTRSMDVSGPDAQNIWNDRDVGLGHAQLRTTFEAERERQPCSLDGDVWLAAHARIDGRQALIQRLRRKDREVADPVPDCELILHAYHVWGDDCPQHLLGDFAFVIWDRSSRKLLCARDHFGVAPLYYAQVADCLIVSNNLNCIKQHPAIPKTINEQAIGDFMLFGYNRNPDTTSWAHIRRVPPAAVLTWRHGELRQRKYWILPIAEPVHLPRPGDYIARFQALFEKAVGDRLRTDRIAVSMSGGLDSTSVAVTAHQLLGRQGRGFDLRAHTLVSPRREPDDEGGFAKSVATALDMPIKFLTAEGQGRDEVAAYANPRSRFARRPEPAYLPDPGDHGERAPLGADFSRVVLKGFGGDPVLSPSQNGWAWLFRQEGARALFCGLARYVRERRRRPPLSIRARIRGRLGRAGPEVPFPDWIAPEFAARLGLRDRWSSENAQRPVPHPTRPEAYRSLSSPFWTALFERQDPGFKSAQVEYRHPFFDVRLVSFLLATPPAPWFYEKLILREAMRGRLPEAVRRRSKTPLARNPLYERLRRDRGLAFLTATPGLGRYVDRQQLRRVTKAPGTRNIYAIANAYALGHWLRHNP